MMLWWYWNELRFVWNCWLLSHFIATANYSSNSVLFQDYARKKRKKYVVYTYSLIVLIKLDFPAPVMPVIAMRTSTSFHPSILLLKNFAMESGLRRPFLSTSFWKSCAYFDSQFIAIGWLEIEQYAACCKQKWAATTTKPYYILKGTRDETFSTVVLLRYVIAPRGRILGSRYALLGFRETAIAAFEIHG